MQIFLTERNPLKRSARDEAAVRAFLEATEHLSPEEAGEEVGLSGVRIRQYREGGWKRLNAATRRSLEEFVERVPARESASYSDGLRYAALRVRELAADLQAVAGPEPDAADPADGEAFGQLVAMAEALRGADQANEPPLRWLGLASALADHLIAIGRIAPSDVELRHWRSYIEASSGRQPIPTPEQHEVERMARLDRPMFGNDIDLGGFG